MKSRTPRLATLAAAAIAIVSGPALAEDSQPDAVGQRPPSDDRAAVDITGRLRATGDGLLLEIGGAVFELHVSGEPLAGGEALGASPPGAQDVRATFSVDGKTTNLRLRFVPATGSDTPAAPR